MQYLHIYKYTPANTVRLHTHHLMTMSAVGEQLLACVVRDSKDHT